MDSNRAHCQSESCSAKENWKLKAVLAQARVRLYIYVYEERKICYDFRHGANQQVHRGIYVYMCVFLLLVRCVEIIECLLFQVHLFRTFFLSFHIAFRRQVDYIRHIYIYIYMHINKSDGYKQVNGKRYVYSWSRSPVSRGRHTCPLNLACARKTLNLSTDHARGIIIYTHSRQNKSHRGTILSSFTLDSLICYFISRVYINSRPRAKRIAGKAAEIGSRAGG